MSEAAIERLLDAMTLEEQVELLSGADFWTTTPVARLDVPAIKVTDGPNGARGGGTLIGGVKSAAFPVGIALGATFDPGLVEEIGAALAHEVRSKGARVLLAPTINIHRSVTNGRNFECYSEDPVLTARLAAAYVSGLQIEGIGATPKHFVANDSEVERLTISSEVDERTLREVYLYPFEVVVKTAQPWALMSAYNKVNGTYASENSWTLTTVLREEWGFDGVVMSDWFGSHTTAETVNAGLDLEMPGPTRDRGAKLVEAVKSGAAKADAVRESARRMLRLIERVGAFETPGIGAERAEDRPETRALIRRAGAEGMVLLKNDGTLPLDADAIRQIAVIGPNAAEARIMGGGSAQLNPHHAVSPLEGLRAAVDADWIRFAKGCSNDRLVPLHDVSWHVEYFDSPEPDGAPVHRDVHEGGEFMWFGAMAEGKVDPKACAVRARSRFVARETGAHRVGLVSAGLSRLYVDGTLVADAWTGWAPGGNYFLQGNDEVIGNFEGEAGRSYEIVVEYSTAGRRSLDFNALRIGITRPLGDAEIAEAVETSRGADVALVFVGRNGEWDSEGNDLPDITLPGRQDELIERVAAANARTIVVLQTGGPVEMPWLDKVAGVIEAWYPGQECGHAIADVLFGKAEPGGRLPQSFPMRWADNPTHSQDPGIYPGHEGKVRYAEGVFVGYRHYDRTGIAPLFPFGFGLSYTTFELTDFSVDDTALAEEGWVRVTAEVRNTGARAGSTVVQVYVSDIEASVARPEKELKGFAKIALDPGASGSVALELDERALAFFDEGARGWRIEPGRFEICAGFSAGEIVARAGVEVGAGKVLPL